MSLVAATYRACARLACFEMSVWYLARRGVIGREAALGADLVSARARAVVCLLDADEEEPAKVLS